MVKAVGLAKQGRWTRWETTLQRRLSWKDIWSMDQGKLSFLLRALADLLPTPANLSTWGLAEDAACYQCHAPYCTLNHILSGCPKSLGDGRYRWRHDKVLQEIAMWVDLERIHANQTKPRAGHTTMQFVAEGQRMTTTPVPPQKNTSILSRATDWELQVDLRKKLVFPQDVAVTTLRPDMVMLSRSTKTIYIVELTVPWEDRLEISHKLKATKYQDLVDEAHIKGWQATLFPIEVGCRGFPSSSTRYLLKQLGLLPTHLKKAIKAIGATAETCSRWVWLKRRETWSTATGEGQAN